jgi:hypothetical protein
MDTGKWLQEIFTLITDSELENRTELLLKFADISAKLGYEISFDDEE